MVYDICIGYIKGTRYTLCRFSVYFYKGYNLFYLLFALLYKSLKEASLEWKNLLPFQNRIVCV